MSRPLHGRSAAIVLLIGGLATPAFAETPTQREAWVQSNAGDLQLRIKSTADGKFILLRATNPEERRAAVLRKEQGDAVVDQKIAKLREQYPFESLAARLSYEREHRDAAAPKLGPLARRQLDEIDRSYGRGSDIRTQSLQMLHSDSVDVFVQRAGNGMQRMGPTLPSPDYLRERTPQPIPFVHLPPLSSEEESVAATPLPDSGSEQLLLPSRELARNYHASAIRSFASRAGYAQDVDHVAGFIPHGFLSAPHTLSLSKRRILTPAEAAPLPSNARRYTETKVKWFVAKLELVSLLKHDKPRVYITENMPRMEELVAAPTRDLDQFEKESLTALQDGEVLRSSVTPNRILMLGPIRATKQCLQCHEVPHGTLLGAFSYELRRDPAISVTPSKEAIQ